MIAGMSTTHHAREPEQLDDEPDRDRAFYEADGHACPRSPFCQLDDEHPGPCDPRTENTRALAIIRLLDLCDGDDAALPAMVEADARLAMAVKLAGGRP